MDISPRGRSRLRYIAIRAIRATETLTVSNIENKAEYDAKAVSATIGGGIQAGLPQLSGAGIGSDSDKADSTTVSAISGGIVDITNDSAQATMSGTDSATTIALLNRDVVVEETSQQEEQPRSIATS